MTFTFSVDGNGVFRHELANYSSTLIGRIEDVLIACGADLATCAQQTMAANGNVDRGYLLQSINLLPERSSSENKRVCVAVGPSFAAYPDRDKTYNDIGHFLEEGTHANGTTWRGPDDSRWAGWHVNWQGNQAHPFMAPTLATQRESIVQRIRAALGWSA